MVVKQSIVPDSKFAKINSLFYATQFLSTSGDEASLTIASTCSAAIFALQPRESPRRKADIVQWKPEELLLGLCVRPISELFLQKNQEGLL